MFTMSLKSAKSGFFDRAAVVRAVDQATRRNLSRFGAYVRQRAKTSIRRPPKTATVRISRPGRPPYSHTGLLKRFIFFAYDADRQSVVIGPGTTAQLRRDGTCVVGTWWCCVSRATTTAIPTTTLHASRI